VSEAAGKPISIVLKPYPQETEKLQLLFQIHRNLKRLITITQIEHCTTEVLW
jgi:hypothetical protein